VATPLAGIDRRFQSILSDKEYLVASVLHPQFKLHFLPEDARLNTKRMVLAYVHEVAEESSRETVNGEAGVMMSSTSDNAMTEDDDDLYSFMNTAQQFAEAGNPITREVETFLEAKSTNIQSLADYPAVAKAFVKANSTLPSSAAVERLFSTAGMILSPRRCKMTDKLFDTVVFLKCRPACFSSA
jgi:hypothetical protein